MSMLPSGGSDEILAKLAGLIESALRNPGRKPSLVGACGPYEEGSMAKKALASTRHPRENQASSGSPRSSRRTASSASSRCARRSAKLWPRWGRMMADRLPDSNPSKRLCADPRCEHPQGWHFRNEGSCLECGCTTFLADANPSSRQQGETEIATSAVTPAANSSTDQNPRKRLITEQEEWVLVQRMVGALVGKYGARHSEETEEQARVLVFVTLAGLGIEVER